MAAKSTPVTALTPKTRAAKAQSVRPGDADFYRGDDYPIKESVGYLLKQLRGNLDRLVDAEMAEHDLTGVQWGPLLILHYGLGSTAADIARWACVDTGAVTRMLDRLEAKRLVQRTPCAKDRRVMQLKLTAEGEQLCLQIPFGLARVGNGMLRGFSREEFATLKSLLRRMLDNVEQR